MHNVLIYGNNTGGSFWSVTSSTLKVFLNYYQKNFLQLSHSFFYDAAFGFIVDQKLI